MYSLGLGQRAHGVREDRTSRASKCRRKPDAANVQMPGQQFGASHHRRREQWTEEETEQSNCHGADVELWHKPEEELEADGDGEVDLVNVLA